MNKIDTSFDGRVGNEKATVHIIDDDRIFSEAIAMLLWEEGFNSMSYMSAHEFLATYEPVLWECGLVDLYMPSMHGLELQSVMNQRFQQMPLIFISAYGSTLNVVNAVRNGAINFLDKPVEEDALLRAVREALAQDELNKSQKSQQNQMFWSLTKREREVLNLFVAAKTTIEIAHLLSISPKTVEKHRSHIYEKTNVDSIPALIRLVNNL